MATESPKVTFNGSQFKNYSRGQTFPLLWKDLGEDSMSSGLGCSFSTWISHYSGEGGSVDAFGPAWSWVVTAVRQCGVDVYFTIPTAEESSLEKGGY